MRRLNFAASKRLMAGGLLWASLVQIFVVNNAIVLPRATSQNLIAKIISALGITQCGYVGGSRFCSPLHDAADGAWIAGGICLVAGTLLNAVLLPADRPRNLAFGSLAVGGAGLTASGLTPYNLHPVAHLVAAGTCFFFGGVGIIVLGATLRQAGRPYWGTLGIVCGVTSLVFTLVTAIKPDPGIQGLVERAAAWPSVMWIIGSGIVIALTVWRGRRTGAD
ncbi:DUF998 domain-containing protein [Streptomyces sp. NPDC001594]|uniref:DUF998 domain-containing protein n=1 Tax=Streptomyces sp. NPDC001594 TaxID=3364590 RepID=UPI00369986D2